MLTPRSEIQLSGSGYLDSGYAEIKFGDNSIDQISGEMELRVIVTPIGPCNGLYISEKNSNGFSVKELGNGTSSVSFDWIAIAGRKGYEKGASQQDLSLAKSPDRLIPSAFSNPLMVENGNLLRGASEITE